MTRKRMSQAERIKRMRIENGTTEEQPKESRYTPEEKANWIAMRQLPASELLARMPDHLKEFTKLVGSWVWIEMDFKPADDVIEEIKSFGFTWSQKRSAWQNPCGHSTFNRRPAPYDPRQRYGAKEVL